MKEWIIETCPCGHTTIVKHRGVKVECTSFTIGARGNPLPDWLEMTIVTNDFEYKVMEKK